MPANKTESFYRSEEMAYCELFLQSEIAFACVSELGELGKAQFTDLNEEMSSYQRKFVRELRECDEMERQLLSLEAELNKENIKIQRDVAFPPNLLPKDVAALKKKISSADKQLIDINKSSLEVRGKKFELVQLRHVLDLTDSSFAEHAAQNLENVVANRSTEMLTEIGQQPAQGPAPLGGDMPMGRLHYVCGVVARERCATLERMLWRIGRGNVLFRNMTIDEEVENPTTGQNEYLNVFMALFQGDALKNNVLKVCSAFHATIFAVPEQSEERADLRAQILTRLEDIETVLNEAKDQRCRLLAAVGLEHRTWTIQVRKVKSVYHILNMLNPDVTDKYLIGEFWCPEREFENIEGALKASSEKAQGITHLGVPYIVQRMDAHPKEVPTYFQMNKVTRAFNNIVSAYGIARYQEVNPALYTVITFPFLFAVMFGDIGHGTIVLLFGMFLCIKEKSLQKLADQNESFKMIFGGRYIILFMGLFSIYTGFIYNDIFSKALNIFQCQWHMDFEIKELLRQENIQLTAINGTNFAGWPYPFGLDPLWMIAQNKIIFINGFKMKISVIVGVVHMLFGIVLSLMNHLHFKQYLNIFCEFIPQMLFILCIFGYMDALIFFKWIKFNANRASEAPSILIGLINMILFKYPEDTAPDRWINENLQTHQQVLVIIAFLSIPWMLLIKPFIIRHQHQVKQRRLVEESRRSSIELVPGETTTAATTSSGVASNPQPGFHDTFSHIEMGERRLQTQVSVISSSNLPVRSRTSTVVSRMTLKKSVSTAPTNNPAEPTASSSTSGEGSGNGSQGIGGVEEEEEKFEFSEVFIHQTIHTIEYVLGLISHTASYLRLWALSLAHAELSEVLWSMVFQRAFGFSTSGTGGFIGVVIIFIFWAVLTLAILCLMEGLSAFLHALRLQWVEFQSKFYGGDGIQFRPFNFKPAYRMKSE